MLDLSSKRLCDWLHLYACSDSALEINLHWYMYSRRTCHIRETPETFDPVPKMLILWVFVCKLGFYFVCTCTNLINPVILRCFPVVDAIFFCHKQSDLTRWSYYTMRLLIQIKLVIPFVSDRFLWFYLTCLLPKSKELHCTLIFPR